MRKYYFHMMDTAVQMFIERIISPAITMVSLTPFDTMVTATHTTDTCICEAMHHSTKSSVPWEETCPSHGVCVGGAVSRRCLTNPLQIFRYSVRSWKDGVHWLDKQHSGVYFMTVPRTCWACVYVLVSEQIHSKYGRLRSC